MRTSLNNIKEIEDYLTNRMDEGDATLFNAKLLLNPELKEQVYLQQKTYSAIKHYGRQQLLKEINAVHDQLFSQPTYYAFKKKILSLFTK